MRASRAAAAGGVVVALVVLGLAASRPSPPPPEPDEVVTFTASGDFTGNSNARAVFAGIAALQPDLHLALGDLSYGATGQERAWCNLVLSAVGPAFPFQLLAGNH